MSELVELLRSRTILLQDVALLFFLATPLTAAALADALGCSVRNVRRQLTRLSKAGLVTRTGESWLRSEKANTYIQHKQTDKQEPVAGEGSASGQHYGNDLVDSVKYSLAEAIARELGAPASAPFITHLLITTGASEGEVKEALASTLKEVRDRKPYLEKVRNPVGFFAGTLRNLVAMRKSVQSIKLRPVERREDRPAAYLPPERVSEYIAQCREMLKKKSPAGVSGAAADG